MNWANYTPVEIYRLKETLHDKGFNRGLRNFFYGVNREPPVREACELIKRHFFMYAKSYTYYFLKELNRNKTAAGNYDWYSMIFTVPYEDLPLYLGSKCKMHRIVAGWRLEIGK